MNSARLDLAVPTAETDLLAAWLRGERLEMSAFADEFRSCVSDFFERRASNRNHNGPVLGAHCPTCGSPELFKGVATAEA